MTTPADAREATIEEEVADDGTIHLGLYHTREINRLLDQFAALLESTAWKPIASAPKDGTRILMSWGNDFAVFGYWQERVDCKWVYHNPLGELRPAPNVKFWLPAPPTPDAPQGWRENEVCQPATPRV